MKHAAGSIFLYNAYSEAFITLNSGRLAPWKDQGELPFHGAYLVAGKIQNPWDLQVTKMKLRMRGTGKNSAANKME